MKLENFAIIKGYGKIEHGKIIYGAIEILNDSEEQSYKARNILDLSKRQILFVRSDLLFSNGSIEFQMRANSHNTGVLLVLKAQDGTSLLIGPTLTEHKFAIATQDDTGNWKSFKIAGDLRNYEPGHPIKFKVTVLGSIIKLYVNGILVCEANFAVKEAPLEFRLCSDSDFEIYDIEVKVEKPKIFVVMQFTDQFNALYKDVIKPIVTLCNYECIRSDDIYSSTPILKDITDSISKCWAIIAEITEDNPNVFYEVGYSHAIGKPTILLCDKIRSKLPFDLSGFRAIYYENTIQGKSKVEQDLKNYLEKL